MANTTFNTRIKLKYDTLANWMANDVVLLKGEMALVEVPAASEAATTAPTVLMKVGDGAKKFSKLAYTSARAADVYGWAKASTKPTYAASEITGLSDYISGKVQDTDTQYKIDFADGKVRLFSKSLGGEFGTTPVAEAPVPSYTLVSGSENGTVSFNGTDVAVKGLGSAAYAETSAFDAAGSATQALTDAKAYADGLAGNYDAKDAAKNVQTALEAKIGTVTEGKTVVGMIADAQTAATYDDTALANRVTALESDTKLSTLIGEDAGKSARTIANEELAKQLIPDNAAEAMNSLAEIAAWIQAHPADASAMNQKISALETAVGEGGSVASQIDTKIAALDLANTYDAKGAAASAETAAKSYADGLASNYDASGAAATAKTEAIAAAKTAADAAYVAKEEGKGLSANDFTDTLKTKIDGIEEGAQVNKIEEIEVNGVAATIADKKAIVSVSLDKIAANTTENYVILDCGSSSQVV